MSEKRLIDANALPYSVGTFEYGQATKCVLKRDVDAAPTVTAEVVRHGDWEERTFFNGCTPDRDLFCSCCNHDRGWYLWEYCPYCGAIMDGQGDGDSDED